MFVIGVSGQMQMGKDTLADRLCLKLNESVANCSSEIVGKFDSTLQQGTITWQRAAFAANVKKVYCDTFGVDMDFVEKWKVISEAPPGFDMSVRQSLQFIGDGFRKIKSSIWLDLAFRDKTIPKIISDVRYINEFRRVKQEGGLNILVAREDKLNDDPNGSEAQIRPYVVWGLNNLAEVAFSEEIKHTIARYPAPDGMELFDVFIQNDGTKDDLYEAIDKQLVPYVQKFVFEFGSEENKCLISS